MFLAGVALLLAFAYAMAWLGVWLGVVVPTVEVAQQVSFTVLFSITFISGVFVPIFTMPDWLQPIAYWNPVTTLASSLRNLWGKPIRRSATTSRPRTPSSSRSSGSWCSSSCSARSASGATAT